MNIKEKEKLLKARVKCVLNKKKEGLKIKSPRLSHVIKNNKKKNLHYALMKEKTKK